ncbi:MAG: hypothetical protein JO331_06590 [Verrucomicrobia bacterium]|nr:hypothetical protein [Verrucomicrobiota bacterium]
MITNLAGLRDRALISTMLFSFARISAGSLTETARFLLPGTQALATFHEKGGKAEFGKRRQIIGLMPRKTILNW